MNRKQFHQHNIESHRIEVFRKFIKKDKFYFIEFSVDLVKSFENHLYKKRNIASRTVANYMVIKRTIFNLGVSKCSSDIQFYPFGKGKYQIRFPETKKIGLIVDEIKAWRI